jgi:hypothetical protein
LICPFRCNAGLSHARKMPCSRPAGAGKTYPAAEEPRGTISTGSGGSLCNATTQRSRPPSCRDASFSPAFSGTLTAVEVLHSHLRVRHEGDQPCSAERAAIAVQKGFSAPFRERNAQKEYGSSVGGCRVVPPIAHESCQR